MIEENFVIGGTRGIQVSDTHNLIARNRVSGATTNYVIVSNNRYGPIIDIRANGAASVSGSAAPSTVNSTDPWANFSY